MRKIYLEIVGMILCVMAGLAIGLHYTTHRFTIGQAIVVCFLLFIAAALTLRKARTLSR